MVFTKSERVVSYYSTYFKYSTVGTLTSKYRTYVGVYVQYVY